MTRLLMNCQSLKYALFKEEQPVYAKDGDGNTVYDDVDGEKIPRVTGYKNGYGEPVDFIGNIAFAGGESEATVYGVSVGDYDAKLVMAKGAIPVSETSIIFQRSEPEYGRDGSLKGNSADYRVSRVAEGHYDTVYLLKRIVHNG